MIYLYYPCSELGLCCCHRISDHCRFRESCSTLQQIAGIWRLVLTWLGIDTTVIANES